MRIDQIKMYNNSKGEVRTEESYSNRMTSHWVQVEQRSSSQWPTSSVGNKYLRLQIGENTSCTIKAMKIK